MKIWLINIGEQIPSDPGSPRLLRTGILAQHLVDRGHEVTWWNATVNHQQKIQRADETTIEDTPEGYRLILLHGRLYQRNVSLLRILSHIENAKAFKKVAPTQSKPDVILCGYPMIELTEAAVRYAQDYHVPIALDIRDLWPDIFSDALPKQLKWTGSAIFSHWNRSLAYSVQNATAVVGVTEGFVDWALKKGGRVKGKLDRAFHLAINPQKPGKEALKKAGEMWDEHGIIADDDRLIGCFAGVFSPRQDLPTIVKAFTLLPSEDKSRLKLVLCGRGDLDDELRRLADNEPNILFAGWRTGAEIRTLLARSDFGIFPCFSSFDYILHYPNKVGEYLSGGLPVMTGLKGLTEKMLGDERLGFFYDEGKPESAKACLLGIIAQKEALADKRGPALKTYHQMFDGARIYPDFCDYIEELAKSEIGTTSEDANVH